LSGSVFVKQFHDRLEIDSPGGFPPGITRENIVFRQAPRNRLVAEILSRCGLVERAGQGMDLIYELCIREAKALPDFLDSDEYVVRMRLAGSKLDEKLLSIFQKIGEGVSGSLSTEELMIINSLYHGQKLDAILKQHLPRLVEMKLVERTKNGGYALRADLASAKPAKTRADKSVIARNKGGSKGGSINDDGSINGSISDPIKGSINDVERMLVVLLRGNPSLTRAKLVELTSKSERTIQRATKSLQDKGIIERVGSRKSGYWKVSEEE
jgi:predicted HTH transcriptional regulator